MVAVTAAGCSYSRRADYDPTFERVPGYEPGDASWSSASKWDYYRNYPGSGHPGPEKYP
jgi:hypothetical protein